MLSAAASHCEKNGLGGLEFAAGIPGTLGGAVYMNAGAFGGEMKDVVTFAEVFEKGAGFVTIPAKELLLGYRTSIAQQREMIFLRVGLQLHECDPEVIREKVTHLRAMRTLKQPLEYPSAGSTFKRPQGYYAGKLIMDAGLAGASVGGAQVSEKHCGFIINRGGATAKDVKALMDRIVREVYEQFGVRLEREVRFLGEV